MHKVPNHMFSYKGLIFLGDLIGMAKKLYPNTKKCIRLNNARVLVVVNLEKALPENISLRSDPDIEILVSYPWLPPRCSNCQTWGHTYKECSQMTVGAVVI